LKLDNLYMHDYLVIIEGVTTISWIFVVFAWFNALIEIGRYRPRGEAFEKQGDRFGEGDLGWTNWW